MTRATGRHMKDYAPMINNKHDEQQVRPMTKTNKSIDVGMDEIKAKLITIQSSSHNKR